MFLGVRLFRGPCAFWAPKVAQRLPKRRQNGAERVPRDTLWNVLKPCYLQYGSHTGEAGGGSGSRFFLDIVSRPSQEASWRAFLAIWGNFGVPGGAL